MKDEIKVKYKHFRYTEELPDVLLDTYLIRVAGYTPVAKGGATLATISKGKDSAQGLAFCGPRDNFSRAVGRTIASGRALAKATG